MTDEIGPRSTARETLSADPYSLRLTPQLFQWVRPWRTPLDIRCGGHDTPPKRPFSASLYPFTTLTKLDYEGYPNHRDKRLESNLSLGPNGWYLGYEDGEFVRAGAFTVGRKLRWDLALLVGNATHADTFVEFVLEPNPRIGIYAGPDRMRCSSGALGATWSGLRPARAWFEVEARASRSFAVRGELSIDGAAPSDPPTFQTLFEIDLSESRYEASTDDAVWQLRWRIDRLANLDAYDSSFQINDGHNGQAIEREIRVILAGLRGI